MTIVNNIRMIEYNPGFVCKNVMNGSVDDVEFEKSDESDESEELEELE